MPRPKTKHYETLSSRSPRRKLTRLNSMLSCIISRLVRYCVKAPYSASLLA